MPRAMNAYKNGTLTAFLHFPAPKDTGAKVDPPLVPLPLLRMKGDFRTVYPLQIGCVG